MGKLRERRRPSPDGGGWLRLLEFEEPCCRVREEVNAAENPDQSAVKRKPSSLFPGLKPAVHQEGVAVGRSSGLHLSALLEFLSLIQFNYLTLFFDRDCISQSYSVSVTNLFRD